MPTHDEYAIPEFVFELEADMNKYFAAYNAYKLLGYYSEAKSNFSCYCYFAKELRRFYATNSVPNYTGIDNLRTLRGITAVIRDSWAIAGLNRADKLCWNRKARRAAKSYGRAQDFEQLDSAYTKMYWHLYKHLTRKYEYEVRRDLCGCNDRHFEDPR